MHRMQYVAAAAAKVVNAGTARVVINSQKADPSSPYTLIIMLGYNSAVMYKHANRITEIMQDPSAARLSIFSSRPIAMAINIDTRAIGRIK